MSFVNAKVYIRVEIDGDEPYFGISVISGGHEFFTEDVDLHLGLDPEILLSKRQLALPNGSVVRLVASVCMVYTQDYWGEHDSSLEISRVRILKTSTPSRKQIKKWDFQSRKRQQKVNQNVCQTP